MFITNVIFMQSVKIYANVIQSSMIFVFWFALAFLSLALHLLKDNKETPAQMDCLNLAAII